MSHLNPPPHYSQHLAPPYPYGFTPLLLQQFPRLNESSAPSGFTHYVSSATHSTQKGSNIKTYRVWGNIGLVYSALAPLRIDPTAVERDTGISTPGIFANAVEGGRGARGIGKLCERRGIWCREGCLHDGEEDGSEEEETHG